MTAVKSVPSLFCLDTNPEIKFDAELQFDLFKEDRVVTLARVARKRREQKRLLLPPLPMSPTLRSLTARVLMTREMR